MTRATLDGGFVGGVGFVTCDCSTAGSFDAVASWTHDVFNLVSFVVVFL
jgi:hypothetical protein